MHRRLVYLWLLLFGCIPYAQAQRRTDFLKDSEVEEIRESAADPVKRVLVFSKIMDRRVDDLREVGSKPYVPGRTEDIQSFLRQIADVANELEDNLEDYEHRHVDVRKALPRLVTATQRWISIARQLPRQDNYELTRTLALESLQDVQKQVEALLPAQAAWFKEHPPAKDALPEPRQEPSTSER